MQLDSLTTFDNRPGMLHISMGVTGMIRFALCASLVMAATSASADSATQTDWSGGPGTYGPVTSWGSDFSIDSGTSWFQTPGSAGILEGIVAHLVEDSLTYPRDVISADINGDGAQDVLGAFYSGPVDIAWWENSNGIGTDWLEHDIDVDFYHAYCICTADIDGDEDIDVLGAANTFNGLIAFWENADGTGTEWTRHIIRNQFEGASGVLSSDIDGDGHLDVVGVAFNDNLVTWWQNVGGTGDNWIENNIATDFGGCYSICSGDIDSDGDMDVAAVSSFPSYWITWWENQNGQGTSWVEHDVANFYAARCICLDDLDGDGDTDIIGAAQNGSGSVWWENSDGSGTRWEAHQYCTGNGPVSVYADDVDGDGDSDIVQGTIYENDITWWENTDGTGTALVAHLVEGWFNYPLSVFSNDMDSDGSVDILAAGYYANSIRWWDLQAHPEYATIESSILDAQSDLNYAYLSWNADMPIGTAVSFLVRGSDDPESMGTWSDTVLAPGSLQSVIPANANYFQYRAILATLDPDTMPTLLDVSIAWDPLGIGDGDSPAVFKLLPVSPNPCAGTPEIGFGLPVAGPVDLAVFDISGRVVQAIQSSEFEPGWHTVQLDDPGPGIYFVRMRADEFEAVRRFAVIE